MEKFLYLNFLTLVLFLRYLHNFYSTLNRLSFASNGNSNFKRLNICTSRKRGRSVHRLKIQIWLLQSVILFSDFPFPILIVCTNIPLNRTLRFSSGSIPYLCFSHWSLDLYIYIYIPFSVTDPLKWVMAFAFRDQTNSQGSYFIAIGFCDKFGHFSHMRTMIDESSTSDWDFLHIEETISKMLLELNQLIFLT